MVGVEMDIQTPEQFRSWFQAWVDDMRSNIVEARTASAWTLIVAYHAVGSSIIENKKLLEANGVRGEAVVTKTAKALGINQAYAYDAVKFAEMFPDLNMFPGDKCMTWNKVRTQYLMTEEQREKQKKPRLCPKCGFDASKKE
jgi:hypothetical protein